MPTWNYPGTTGWPGLPVDNRGFRVRGGGGGGRNPAAANAGGSATPTDSARAVATPPAQSPAPASTANETDPDLSVRWIDADRVVRSRQWVADHFPDLKDVPLLETRACHYEATSSRNFVIDRHPDLRNVWIAGGGNAEAFKQGPVLGEYIAKRVLGDEGDPEIAKQFRIPATEFDANSGRRGGEE
jgi:glycine/D-amino acid oxidase-like deaminating enzyme